MASGSALNDGLWHSVAMISGKGRLSVTVDEDEGSAQARPPFLVVTGSQLFFGGRKNLDGKSSPHRFPLTDFMSAVLQVALVKGTSRNVRTLSAPSRAAYVN